MLQTTKKAIVLALSKLKLHLYKGFEITSTEALVHGQNILIATMLDYMIGTTLPLA